MLTIPMQQGLVFGTLVVALVLFITGRWRYDLVALLALLIVSVTGIVPGAEVFTGFGHPAVITVAAVLIVSRGLQNAGLVDYIARWLSGLGNRPTVNVAALTALVAVCSGFMNNVGALALLMPVAIRMAHKSQQPPSILLMPLAFGSLLGGMTTLIGTPPNIIIATFRAQTDKPPFGMFDFAWVGDVLLLQGHMNGRGGLTVVDWLRRGRRVGDQRPRYHQVGLMDTICTISIHNMTRNKNMLDCVYQNLYCGIDAPCCCWFLGCKSSGECR